MPGYSMSHVVPVLQVIGTMRVVSRFVRTVGGTTVPCDHRPGVLAEIAVLLPVLNEESRLEACLLHLCKQGPEVGEILVIDGGSTDGTRAIVQRFAEHDDRLRLITAEDPQAGANGKAWQLEAGRRAVRSAARWIVTIDADVQIAPACCQSMVAFADQEALLMLSLATTQIVSGAGEGLLHPSMLTTIVYRYGIPGHATDRIEDVQASGQCMLIDRQTLRKIGGFMAVLDSVCEDVTLARGMAAAGHRVGFYESDGLARTAMYTSAGSSLRNWTRSLPVRDQYSNVESVARIAETVLVQGLPLWRMLFRRGSSPVATSVDRALLGMRCGVLLGTARAYPQRPFTYWLSPLVDLPVTVLILGRSLQRRFSWRGRTITVRKSA